MSDEIIHIYNDGSKLVRMSAKALLLVPIWKGNRIIDHGHVEIIRQNIKNPAHLDQGYRIIAYREEDAWGRPIVQKYIVDGQHRLSVLREHFASSLCEPDFAVTATEIEVASEADAIEYFNTINCAKPIHYEEDPVLVANKYLHVLQRVFPGKYKAPLIRSIATHRPYVHVDKIRDLFVQYIGDLKKIGVDEFATRASDANAAILRELEIGIMMNTVKDVRVAEKCIELRFGVAYDMARWLQACVKLSAQKIDV